MISATEPMYCSMVGAHPRFDRARGMRVREVQEAATSVLEVVIVLVIVAVMLAMMLRTRDANGSAAHRVAAVSAARVMGDAIEDFRKDHGGRPPVLGHADDWPTTTLESRNRGPMNTYTGRPYLRHKAVGGVESDNARIVGGGASAPASVRFALQYYQTTGRPAGWVIVVRDQRGKYPPCYLRGGSMALPISGVQPC